MPKRSAILMVVVLGLVSGWAILRVERRRETKVEVVSTPAPSQRTHPVEFGPAPSSQRESITPATVLLTEEVESRVELSASVERTWLARIVDGESQAALAQASIAILEDDPYVEISDGAWKPVRADGTVELALASFEGTTLAVRCPDHAVAYVLPSFADVVQIVQLWRPVTVAVRTRDERTLQSEPVTVEMLVEDSKLFTGNAWRSSGQVFAWEARRTEEGALLFEDLPPYRDLALEARAGETQLHHELLFLSPGERKELEIVLGDGCAIAGRAQTPEGDPVMGLEVWLVGQRNLPGRYFEEHEDVQGRTTTDARGAFSFEGVAPGVWFVGPAAGKESETLDERVGAPRDSIAPMAESVRIQPGDGVVPVTLTCWSGLYIRGRVLDSAHEAAAGALLSVEAREVLCDGEVEADGTFAIGPLVPGEYTLVAESFEGTDRESAPVLAHAGDENVELRLRPATTVVALVLDEQGQPAHGAEMTMISSTDEYVGRGTMETDEHGRVTFDGVEAGRHAVIATRGSSIGVCQVNIEGLEAPREELRISLQPGATLVLASPGAKRQLGYRIRHAGWMITEGFFGPGDEPSVLVPSGDVVVELLSWGKSGEIGVAESRTMTANSGDRVRVELEAPAMPR